VAKKHDLPPPPENPVTSPPVLLSGEESVMLDGLPGEPSIEARVRGSRDAHRAVLLCHPHPLYGGTMHSAVVVAIGRVLAERDGKSPALPERGLHEAAHVATLRFNYRGVGKSGGAYGDGIGETLDARAALVELRTRFPDAKLAVCGYSFGTWVGLRAASLQQGVERVALVAPAVRIFHFVAEDAARFQGRLAIYVGDRDEFCDVSEATALTASLGATLTVFPGNDHYFLAGRRKLAEAVVPFLTADSTPGLAPASGGAPGAPDPVKSV
jgi:alpha/beta superfamily hydrolase